MRRGVGTLLVAFLAASLFLGPIGPPSAPQTQAERKTPSPERVPATRRAPDKNKISPKGHSKGAPSSCDTGCQVSPGADLVVAVNKSVGAVKPASDLTALWTVSATNSSNTHFLIATVPDPVHTHLSLLFDRQIVAIEEAVQQAGYLFTRAYLPWDNEQHAENADFRVRVEEKEYVRNLENYPGVLIFHNRETPNSAESRFRPLLVFLVGETPTGGIEKVQFANAIKAMQDICQTKCADPQPIGANGKLFILGPTFSGSLYSLYSILKPLQEQKQFSAFTIHSGNATSTDTINWFRNRFPQTADDKSGPTVVFRTFQEGNAYAVRHLLNFACRQDYRAGQLAVLSEDETAFGNVEIEAASVAQAGSAPPRDDVCPDDPQGQKEGRVLRMNFPRDVSQLRNAYQQDTRMAASSSNANPPSNTLQLNLADTGNNDDSVNSFSHGQTPLSQEAIMMAIVSNLKEHRTNLVLIEASNPLDVVFLVRYLRVADPDARIVTVGSDLLLPRQVDDPRLRGVLQLTSYSLMPEIDEYAPLGACGELAHLNRIFPSDYSAGTFNAALSLMQFQGSAIASSCILRPAADLRMNRLGQLDDLYPAAYAQYAWPSLAGPPPADDRVMAPPLWLTVQGRDRFWPVELLDASAETSRVGDSLLHRVGTTSDYPDFDPLPPGPWIVVCTLAAAFGLIYVLLALNGSVMSPSIFLANFALVDDPWRNRTIFAAGLFIFEIFVCLSWPDIWSLRHTLLFVPIFLLIGIVILRDLWRRGGRFLALLLFLLGVVFTWGVFRYFPGGSAPLKHFVWYRYWHVTSGVSPAAPFLFLFAGCLWACWQNLSGRPPWDRTGEGPPLPSKDQVTEDSNPAESLKNQPLSALTRERNEDLLAFMSSPLTNRLASAWALTDADHGDGDPLKREPKRALHIRLWIFLRLLIPGLKREGLRRVILFRTTVFTAIAMAITLPALFGVSAPHRILSLEGCRYDWAYTILIVLVLAVMLWETFRVSFLWLELRVLLMALDRLPLSRGFARIQDFRSRRLWELGGNTFEDFFAIQSREIQTAEALINARRYDEAVWQPLQDVPDAVAAFSDWMQKHRSDRRTKPVEFDNALAARLENLQMTMSVTCASTLHALNHAWSLEARPAWETKSDGAKKCEANKQELPLTLRLAEDFVCLFYFNFISSVFSRMRTLVMTIAGLYVFILLSFSSYPFQPASAFHTAMLFVLILIVLVFAIVYGQAHKDAIISRITNTDEGKLGAEFWFRLAALVSVPLLSLLAAKFPEIGGFIFSWLAPASQAFK